MAIVLTGKSRVGGDTHGVVRIGAQVERREDGRLVTGEATYTDDVDYQRLAHMIVARSRYGHAIIEQVDTTEAEEMDGVLDVLTGDDLTAADIPGEVPIGWEMPKMHNPTYPILCRDQALYHGQPIAVVVAEDRYVANDAAGKIGVAYDRLDAVTDPVLALEDGSPTVHEGAPDNRAVEWEVGDADAVEDAFKEADHIVDLELVNQRVIPDAMEPRATVAEYDVSADKLSVHMASQNPHLHREMLAEALAHPEHRIRVVAPEVGGGFGSKTPLYPEEALTTWCAKRLGRPVKWQATRSEAHMGDAHGRGLTIDAAIALDDDGRIRGLRSEVIANMGAYLLFFAPHVPTIVHGSALSGAYDIPAIHCQVTGAFTNATPMDAYRGAGQPEACFLLERLVHLAACELGMDPVEIRRRNFIDPEQFPFTTKTGAVYDSGDYEAALNTALEAVDYAALRERQRELREEERYLGIGISSFVQSSGMGPSRLAGQKGAKRGFWESGIVRFHLSGTVTAYVGTSDHGQGHETSFAQILSDHLGVPFDDIEIIESDTDEVPYGLGTYASRSAPVGGSALVESAEKLVEKGRQIAAHHLEASVDDVVFDDGVYHVSGTFERSLAIQEIARQACLAHDLPAELEPGFEMTTFYDPTDFTCPFGTHIVVVEVDPQAGEVEFERYVAVTDCGPQINPTIVEGQVHGAIAQGLGQALYEEAVYDDKGTLLTGTMQDYAIPKASQLPELWTDWTETPCPHNPLGVKGVGEAGTIASPPAIVNAIVDALAPFGVTHLEMPITGERIWNRVNDASTQST